MKLFLWCPLRLEVKLHANLYSLQYPFCGEFLSLILKTRSHLNITNTIEPILDVFCTDLLCLVLIFQLLFVIAKSVHNRNPYCHALEEKLNFHAIPA